MKWIKSKRRKPKIGMETVVRYGNGKKEIVFWDAKLIKSVMTSKAEFEWFELPKEWSEK